MKTMQFDDAFSLVGGSGRFQAGLFTLMSLVAFLSVETMNVNFTAYAMDHWCEVSELIHLPYNLQKYIAIPVLPSDGRGSYDMCHQYDLNYSLFTHEDFLHWNRSEVLANNPPIKKCNHWIYDQSVFKDTAVSSWDLVCDRKWLVDLISTVTLAGCLVGSLFGGALADRYGRKKVAIPSIVLKIVGGYMAAWAPNYTLHVLGRFIIGTGTSVGYAVVFVWLLEMVSPDHRNLVGIGYAIIYSAGFMFIPTVAFFIREHVKLQVALTSPIILLLLYVWLIPESPRWLLLMGKKEEAEKVLRQIAALNRRSLPHDFSINKIHVTSEEESPSTSLVDLVRRPVMRKRSLIVFFDWFVSSLIFFAVSLNAGTLLGNIFLNTFLLAAVEIPANIACMLANNTIGRRYTHVISFLLAGLISLATVPVQVTATIPMLATVFAMIGKAGSTSAFNGLYVYSTELFPTDVRFKGVSTSSLFARLSGMVAPYAGGLLGDVWLPLPSLVFGVFGTAAGLITLGLPETLNKNLPETLEDVEDSASLHNDNIQERGRLMDGHRTEYKYGSTLDEEKRGLLA